MGKIHDVIDSELEKFLEPKQLIPTVFNYLLEKKGIYLNDEQLNVLRDHIEEPQDDVTIRLDIKPHQCKKSKLSSNSELHAILNEAWQETNEILKDADSIAYEIGQDATESFIDDFTERVITEFNNNTNERILKERKEDQNVNRIIEAEAGDTLKKFRLYISLFEEAFFQHTSDLKTISHQHDKDTALLRLCCRAAYISKEICCLLENGYADGAQARWRSLHEIAVIVNLLSESDDELSRRYLEHRTVTDWRNSHEYNQFCQLFNPQHTDKDHEKELDKETKHLLDKYGESYKHPYGWASAKLGRKKPTFKDIEEFISLDHMRLHYSLANISIHSGSKGAYFRLGLPYGEEEEAILLGPSRLDIEQPLIWSVSSLQHIAAAYLTVGEFLDSVVMLTALKHIGDELAGRLTGS